jgi:hypothetical protein
MLPLRHLMHMETFFSARINQKPKLLSSSKKS